MERKIYIGTCGYSYPDEPPNGWGGVFYPRRGKRRVDELEFYAGYFNAVEINSTLSQLERPPPRNRCAAGAVEHNLGIDRRTEVRQFDKTATDGAWRDIAYLCLHGRNQEKWWTHQDAWERYDFFYRAENIRRLAAKR